MPSPAANHLLQGPAHGAHRLAIQPQRIFADLALRAAADPEAEFADPDLAAKAGNLMAELWFSPLEQIHQVLREATSSDDQTALFDSAMHRQRLDKEAFAAAATRTFQTARAVDVHEFITNYSGAELNPEELELVRRIRREQLIDNLVAGSILAVVLIGVPCYFKPSLIGATWSLSKRAVIYSTPSCVTAALSSFRAALLEFAATVLWWFYHALLAGCVMLALATVVCMCVI